jgi:FkbM family methyltransferase
MANKILLENFRAILGDFNFTYIDIGSRGGLSPEWEQVKELINIILFEPDIDEADRLNHSSSSNVKVIPRAVWSKKGVVKFNCMRNPSYSSVLAPNTKALDGTYYFSRNFYTIDKVLDIEVDTLEDILNNFDEVQIDFLKIDIQGAENHIFESIKYWNDILGVHTEAYGEKLYKNGADISTTLRSLYAHKLQLFDIKVIAGSPIVDVDNIKMFSDELLNARPNSGYKVRPMVYDLLLLKDKLEVLKNKDVIYIRKMIFILCVYKYFDYAIYILLKTFNQKIFSLDEKNNLLKCISNIHKASLSKYQNFKEKIRSPSYDLKER